MTAWIRPWAILLCLICGARSAEINYDNAKYTCNEVICDLSCEAYPKLCNHIAIIGTIDETAKTFTPFKTAVILRNGYMLTTVSSGIASDFDSNKKLIYFAAQTTDGYLFSDKYSSAVLFIPGDFDLHGWNDIMLIKLKNGRTHGGVDIVRNAEKLKTALRSKDKIRMIRYGFVVNGGKIELKEGITTHNPADCTEYFAYDEAIFFDKDLMYCQSDEKAAKALPSDISKWLTGLPVFDTFDNQEALVGLRSLRSGSPHHQHVFLVTKLAYHCEWIKYHNAPPCVGKFFYYRTVLMQLFKN